MDEDLSKIIDQQIEKLPENIRKALISVDYKVKLRDITRRQKLLIDRAGKLEIETTLVMIGLEPLADYVPNLQRELEIPLTKAKEIALDISENIFKPIRESLRAMNAEVEKEEKWVTCLLACKNTLEFKSISVYLTYDYENIRLRENKVMIPTNSV